MKSFLAKKGQVEQKWHVVDAQDKVLGRLASDVAMVLMGKTKPQYTPNIDTGDYVIVLNAEKIKVTGSKMVEKEYDYYTRYPGGHKYVSFADMMDRHPERVVEMAVKRMLPKSKLGNQMFRKLKVYRGGEHEHAAQKPEKLEI